MWLHGFTQTKNSAYVFRSTLAHSFDVVTIDLPGHGDNWAQRASLSETATLLAEVLPCDPFVLAGYSMGARVALHFALAYPDRLRSLLLVSATLGIEDETERRSRRERDETLAAHALEVGGPTFLAEWLAQPLFTGSAIDDRERRSRSLEASGLADSLRSAGTGTQRWLGERAAAIALPTTVVVGERDVKFVREGQRIVEVVANSRLVVVAGAGHAVHLDAPHEVARVFDSLGEVEVTR